MTHQHVVVVDTDGKLVREIGNASAASGLDYHLKDNLLFYSDVNARKVFRSSLTGSGSSSSQLDITLPGAWSPISVAVDWVTPS
jgi:serine/threonine protein kinase HipA of HipAB toxin-antitoxin module